MTENITEDNLTDVEFWDTYWEDYQLPAEIDTSRAFERCVSQEITRQLSSYKLKGKVLEIGCAPGKWLAFMANQFDLEPHGIEYSKKGMEITNKNMKLLNFPDNLVVEGDFFTLEPKAEFDVVMSLGFIKHFDDVDMVIERHLKWLKPGGKLILGVPNFRGVNKITQGILNQTILDKHNLSIMNRTYFNSVAKKFDLIEGTVNYIGGYDPVLQIGDKGPVSKLQFCINILLEGAKKIRKLRFWDKVNHPIFSSYILAIYEKK